MRKRRSNAEGQALVEQFRASGLNKTRFAGIEHGDHHEILKVLGIPYPSELRRS